MNALLAGMCISLGAYVYLNVGGITGAVLFSVGLLAILRLHLDLFTGQCGKLSSREITWGKVAEIWVGNFLGTFLVAFLLLLTPGGNLLANKAVEIVALRISNGPLTNFILGIGCGLCMYIAVKSWIDVQPLYTIFAVACFILCGFNHCVADMFYLNMGMMQVSDLLVLIPTTLGNLVGCNIIPGLQEE